jgi:hypothetical protein
VAECVWAPEWVDEDGFADLPICAGPAGPEHLERDAANRQRRAEAKLAAKKLIKRNQLPMKVVAVDFVDSGIDFDQLVVVYFTAPHRVDFRTLVSELARTLHAESTYVRSARGTPLGSSAGWATAAATCAAPPS